MDFNRGNLIVNKAKKIIIGIDVDNVISDFTTLFIKKFNEKTGENLKREDLKNWNLKQAINELYNGRIDGEISNTILLEEGFFSDLTLKNNSLNILKKISNNDLFEIKIVTAIYPHLTTIRDRWLKANLKDIKYSVFYESKKQNIKMDYLIDDGIHNLESLEDIIGKDNCLCIFEPYNAGCKYNNFESLDKAILHILEKEELSHIINS